MPRVAGCVPVCICVCVQEFELNLDFSDYINIPCELYLPVLYGVFQPLHGNIICFEAGLPFSLCRKQISHLHF